MKNDGLYIEYNYTMDEENVDQVWFSLHRNTITKFKSFEEFVQFANAMMDIVENIAEETGTELLYDDDDNDKPISNKWLN